MVSLRCSSWIPAVWVVIASVEANVTTVSFKLSSISKTLLMYENPMVFASVSSALKCSSVCSRRLSCAGYKFHITSKTCRVFSTSDANSTVMRNSVSKHATAENLIWKRMSKKEKEQQETEYLGCYTDSFIRFMNDHHIQRNDMTQELCFEKCRSKGCKYAGTEHGDHCFCGKSHRSYSLRPEEDCSYPCAGNRKQRCGGEYRLSLYKINI